MDATRWRAKTLSKFYNMDFGFWTQILVAGGDALRYVSNEKFSKRMRILY